MKKHKLQTVFVATDADGEGNGRAAYIERNKSIKITCVFVSFICALPIAFGPVFLNIIYTNCDLFFFITCKI